MILQYKGFKNNWTYEEADSITVSTMRITEAEIHEEDSEKELEVIREISKQIHKEIQDETHCNNITWITEKPVYSLGFVKVAILRDKNKEVTYVFDAFKEVYLLSNSGKTVKRI